MLKTYLVLNKYTQSAVDVFLTEAEAKNAIKEYESDDKDSGSYIKNNYLISLHYIND